MMMFLVYNDSVPFPSVIRCYRDSNGTMFFCLRVLSDRCVYGVVYGDCPYSGEPLYFSVFRDRIGNSTVWYQDNEGIIQSIDAVSEWFVKAANYRFPSCTD